jgi:hypothetical protein
MRPEIRMLATTVLSRIASLARGFRSKSAEALTTSIMVSALALTTPASATAQSIWLDEPVQQWNQPGMPVPTVQRSDKDFELDPRCMAMGRGAETPMDTAIEQAGWRLFNSYEAGWGVTLIAGLSGHDGMCRPAGYHAFVFVDGQFAGTLAPVPSMSRSDGALTRETRIQSDGRLSAVFVRYAPEDPLCCPSRPSVAVNYRVERTPDGPVLLVDNMTQVPRM